MFKTIVSDDVTIFEMNCKRLDAGNAPSFRESVKSGLGTPKRLLLDLGMVEFMDSTGIGAIIFLQREVKVHGGTLHICSPAKAVATILRLMKFSRLVDIFPTREEALKSLESPAP